ncbi:transglutaminase-like domain-containing protein [Aestuariibaculum sp. YM273]|uniref:transglutaminase-like domain-containing protein n=1 Tax=Aestuariibaculum sp. YM273 TaxID=3070659 RepID=UPI0027DC2B88|nr:transglutaminase-like domain-containing protein [Aestuariibaculum sp. YM273]WMI64034.1 transglutaminase-like domain-containing protein [Aestuariibaculum sp. YM273]
MKLTTCFLCLSLSVTAFAQNVKFGKVSKEEIQEKINPLDSSANATYLYKYRRTHVEYDVQLGEFYLATDIQERIKIYNKEGFDYATRIVNLSVSGNDEDEIIGLKAYTYNLENDKVEDVKLEKDAIFETEKHKYLNQVTFTMPNLKEGSVIEYKYTINSPFFWSVNDFYFQNEIPIKIVEAQFDSPEYFNFKKMSKGYFPVRPETGRKSDRTLDCLRDYDEFNLTNVPALKDEPYVNNIDNYRSAISYELSFVNWPMTPIKYFATTWEDVVKTIYDSSGFGDELKKSSYYKEDIEALIAGESQPLAKAAKIYNYVKSSMKWNGYVSKYAQEGVKKAYLRKEGNVADINLMLTSMLRYAGLNANPVLVSTRDNGIPLFPTLDGYNYVITAIESPEGILLLDATTSHGLPNVLPVRALNWEGRIVRENKTSSTVNLYPKEKSVNMVSLLANLNETGDLEGSIRFVRSNYFAMNYRDDYFESDQDTYLENLENKFGNIQISDFNVKNEKDITKPVIESFKFSLESQADVINNKIYFSPLFFLKTSENPFRLEKREFPVDFSYPKSNKYKFVIKVPENFKVESTPESVQMMLPDNLGAFKYIVKSSPDGKSVHITLDTEINQSIIAPIYYEHLKAYFSKLIEKQSEQIVLTKV